MTRREGYHWNPYNPDQHRVTVDDMNSSSGNRRNSGGSSSSSSAASKHSSKSSATARIATQQHHQQHHHQYQYEQKQQQQHWQHFDPNHLYQQQTHDQSMGDNFTDTPINSHTPSEAQANHYLTRRVGLPPAYNEPRAPFPITASSATLQSSSQRTAHGVATTHPPPPPPPLPPHQGGFTNSAVTSGGFTGSGGCTSSGFTSSSSTSGSTLTTPTAGHTPQLSGRVSFYAWPEELTLKPPQVPAAIQVVGPSSVAPHEDAGFTATTTTTHLLVPEVEVRVGTVPSRPINANTNHHRGNPSEGTHDGSASEAIPQPLVRPLFVGQLPYITTAEQIAWVAATFCDGIRLFNFDQIQKRNFKKGGNKLPTGCFHCSVVHAEFELAVSMLHESVLVDETGVWAPQSPREKLALQTYCTLLQNDPSVRPPGLPFRALVVQSSSSTFNVQLQQHATTSQSTMQSTSTAGRNGESS